MVNIFVEKMHATSHIISLISAMRNVQCYTIFSSTDLESDQAISLDVTGKRRLTEIRGYVDSGKYFDTVKKYLFVQVRRVADKVGGARYGRRVHQAGEIRDVPRAAVRHGQAQQGVRLGA